MGNTASEKVIHEYQGFEVYVVLDFLDFSILNSPASKYYNLK